MKKNRQAAVLFGALLTVLAVFLAARALLSTPARAADYLVTERDGTYWVDADTQVYPVELGPEADGWTVEGVTVDENVYRDAEGGYYAPDNSTTFRISIRRAGYWLPLATDEQKPVATQFDYTDGTILTYTFSNVPITENGSYFLSLIPPTIQAEYRPQEFDEGCYEATVYMPGAYVPECYLSFDGVVFQWALELRMEYVPMESISAEGLYDFYFTQIDGEYAYGYFFPGTEITLKTVGDYRFGDTTHWNYTYSGIEFVQEDDQTITIRTAETIQQEDDGVWEEERCQVVLMMDILSPITVNFAFTESGYASVLVDYEEVTSTTVLEGTDLTFTFQVNSAMYSVEDWQTAITGCTIQGPWDETAYPVDSFGLSEYGDATIGADEFRYIDECTVTFTMVPDAFTRLVTVTDASGPGYTLTCLSGTASGEPGYISLHLKIDAAYNQSVPVLTAPEGWVINENMEGGLLEDGSMEYYIIMAYGDGTQPVPAAPMDLTVSVSGIVANPSGGGGGGSWGGSEEEEIRVENELNQEGASSDTMLWPNGTKENNGVSITTVTDKELEALIDLAQQHIEDIQELEGDGYKEGIIVIEDLRPNSNIHTYILKLTESQFERISEEEWDRFTVQTPAGSLSLYGNTIREVAGLEGAVDFTIARLEYEGRPGADVTLTVDGKPVTTFSEVYGIRAFVPYVPAQEEDVNALLMDYIHEDGTVERVTESFYDETAGGVYVFTDHLSKFGVAYRPAVYSDVGADHWASPYVTFLAARGLLGQGSTFRPDDKATRGELLELLAEALSAANLPSRAVQVYSDVPASSSVARAASWAYYNNLTGSIASDGKLRPNEAITREDMAALVGNVASGVGLRLRSKGLDTGYTDLDDVASYARSAVIRLRAAGILEMPDNYKFNPKATLNRGEMARIVANLLSSL